MEDSVKAKILTEAINKTNPKWTYDESLRLIQDARGSGTRFITVSTDNGTYSISIMGDTILLNGKDITGSFLTNVTNVTTYGNNSPAIFQPGNSSKAEVDNIHSSAPSWHYYLGVPAAILAVITLGRLAKRFLSNDKR